MPRTMRRTRAPARSPAVQALEFPHPLRCPGSLVPCRALLRRCRLSRPFGPARFSSFPAMIVSIPPQTQAPLSAPRKPCRSLPNSLTHRISPSRKEILGGHEALFLRALRTGHRHFLLDLSCAYVLCSKGNAFFQRPSSFLLAVRNQNRSLRRRRELVTTLMELSAMAASAR
jgi:hypothetical protein